jgi:hypothetical protein
MNEVLKDGIWEDEGDRTWWPVEFYPTRSKAKQALIDSGTDADWINIRVRQAYLREKPSYKEELDVMYSICHKDAEGAFKCWELECKL